MKLDSLALAFILSDHEGGSKAYAEIRSISVAGYGLLQNDFAKYIAKRFLGEHEPKICEAARCLDVELKEGADIFFEGEGKGLGESIVSVTSEPFSDEAFDRAFQTLSTKEKCFIKNGEKYIIDGVRR
ncbi:MAG: hypothetical protein HY513_04055, partial [Candidatus Aenigmarchaeota archaeon]|nr:hypothetical protein [Candidatus Aenigmarchaeota archaeon]